MPVDTRLQDKHYDYVIDLHNNIRSKQVKQLVKMIDFTVDKRNVAKWIYVNTKKQWLPIGHFVNRCFMAIAPLGVMDDQQRLVYFLAKANDFVSR